MRIRAHGYEFLLAAGSVKSTRIPDEPVFCTNSQIILAHEEIAEKTNEIPAFQDVIQNLGLRGVLFTGDAMHCQKNF